MNNLKQTTINRILHLDQNHRYKKIFQDSISKMVNQTPIRSLVEETRQL